MGATHQEYSCKHHIDQETGMMGCTHPTVFYDTLERERGYLAPSSRGPEVKLVTKNRFQSKGAGGRSPVPVHQPDNFEFDV